VSTDEQTAATKELRLALVLYGGVSLAIYMHGITKELHKLIAASRALDVDAAENPFPAATTEHVYWETLKHMSEAARVRTRVVVDVIAGTSAGGINGVYLAKALAQNVRQDELRDLWIQKGDIAKLLRGSSRWPAKLWPVKARLGWLLLRALRHPGRNEPILRGDVMSRWFVEALEQMDGHPYVPGAETLMPEDHDLQLFVTATDFYGYDLDIPIESPPVVTDRRHRHVFEFRRSGAVNQFEPRFNYGLAFVSRATSSFPGAFPAVSFGDFERYFDPPISLGDFGEEFCRIHELSGWSAKFTYFIDGGVLNNYPFDHAIRAIRARHADVEVDRRLLYVQPDPRALERHRGQEPAPGWVPNFWGGFAAIPRREPIVDDLRDVMRLNERVSTIRDIIEVSFGDVRSRIEALPDLTNLDAVLPGADDAKLLAIRAAATAAANEDIGDGYATYVRMKIRSVADDFARLVNQVCNYPEASDHAFFVRAVVSLWAEQAGLFDKQQVRPTPAQIAFLKEFDLQYTQRLLHFLIAAASWWYRDVGADDTPTRGQLGAAKRLLYSFVERLEGITTGAALEPALTGRLQAIFDEAAVADAIRDEALHPAAFLAPRRADLDAVRAELADFLHRKLGDLAAGLTGELREVTKDWSAGPRTDFFVRYLGFPFWDVLLFPVQLLGDAAERDEVKVVRMSPLDSDLLDPLPGTPKLGGTSLHHFGAFFERSFRENDYLWGRLDGAERLLVLLLGPAEGDCAKRCADAFEAILDEEAPDLPTTPGLVEHVRAQLGPIRSGGAAPGPPTRT